MSEIAPHILNGKCRYRDGEPADVLTTKRPGPLLPVMAMRPDGTVTTHAANGAYLTSGDDDEYDLIPLAPEPRVAREWTLALNKLSGDITGPFPGDFTPRENFEKILVREVLPEQEASEAVGSKDSVPSPLPTRVEDTGTVSATPAFKVGDRVVTHRFPDDLPPHFLTEMRPYVGKAGFIESIYFRGECLVHGFYWPASALTPAPESEPEPGFKYYRVTGMVDSVILKIPTDGAPPYFWRKPNSSVWVPCFTRMTNLSYFTETDAAGVPLEGGAR